MPEKPLPVEKGCTQHRRGVLGSHLAAFQPVCPQWERIGMECNFGHAHGQRKVELWLSAAETADALHGILGRPVEVAGRSCRPHLVLSDSFMQAIKITGPSADPCCSTQLLTGPARFFQGQAVPLPRKLCCHLHGQSAWKAHGALIL
jgi:hypothetical protein